MLGKARQTALLLLLLSSADAAQAQSTKLTASDSARNDHFGRAVSLSGDTALVGARGDDDDGDDSGSAYIFQRKQGGPNEWGWVAKLTASDAASYDFFGHAVSLSGDTALVGAWKDDDGGELSGSAYIFQQDEGGPNAWGQVAKLTASDAAAGDWFGNAVSLSGDTALVGAKGSYGTGGSSSWGSAYIFQRDQNGTNAWGQVARLTVSDAAAGSGFGSSVSLSGDTALVGAYENDDSSLPLGLAYIFQREPDEPNAWRRVANLTASDAVLNDSFGWAVSLSGDTALVGAWASDDDGEWSGSAYIFQRGQGEPNAWVEIAKLTASDAAAGDGFGWAVSLSGDTALVGAYRDDDDGYDSGSAYIFKRNQGGPNNWGQVTKLTAVDAAAGDQFGAAVSLSGDMALVGASTDDDNGDDSGSAYIFSLLQPQTPTVAPTVAPTAVPVANVPDDQGPLSTPAILGIAFGVLLAGGAVFFVRVAARRGRSERWPSIGAKEANEFATDGGLGAAVVIGEALVNDAFLTHDWGTDELGRNNHRRVAAVNQLLGKAGVKTWFDEDRLSGNVVQQMTAGIQSSRKVVVFVTQRYMRKLEWYDGADNCQREFFHAANVRKPVNMIACVMEPRMLDSDKWTGPLQFNLGSKLFMDFSTDEKMEANIGALVKLLS